MRWDVPEACPTSGNAARGDVEDRGEAGEVSDRQRAIIREARKKRLDYASRL